MATDNKKQIEKIDKKLNRIHSLTFPPWLYETYIEHKIIKLEEKKRQLQVQENERTQ